jgi:hypothetical protein
VSFVLPSTLGASAIQTCRVSLAHGHDEGVHQSEADPLLLVGKATVLEDVLTHDAQDAQVDLRALGADPAAAEHEVLRLLNPRAARLQHPDVVGGLGDVVGGVVLLQCDDEVLAEDVGPILLVIVPPVVLDDGDLLGILVGDVLAALVAPPEALDARGHDGGAVAEADAVQDPTDAVQVRAAPHGLTARAAGGATELLRTVAAVAVARLRQGRGTGVKEHREVLQVQGAAGQGEGGHS